MTGGGSLGIRSGSYGSLQQQLQQNGALLPIQTTHPRKTNKTVRDREKFSHWIWKFAGRKKVGMLFLCLISAAVFGWVLYVGKGEETNVRIAVVSFNNSTPDVSFSPTHGIENISNGSLVDDASKDSIMPPALLPPAPEFFLGYILPPGHPCNTLTVPPPPADKKRTGPRPCPVCYLPVEEAIALMPRLPSPSPVLKNLKYVHEETLSREGEFGGSDFGGYPTLRQRNDSYDIRDSMNVHCGFVKGSKPGRQTGFDMDESNLLEMDQCQGVVVASAIFGNFDEVQQPQNMSEYTKKTVCFYLFVDEVTYGYLKNTSTLEDGQRIGLWRVVVARNLPYNDSRRSGKIPKLLLHRIFPRARYSIWIDGKLELVVDPYQILERFLWRKNATFSISRHYKRFDVFVEAEANKAAGKYDNASLDFQIEFYKKEGLSPYTEAKLPITSDVPEGCVIIREHVPISNLFSCLWFNEVDRFTSRDQISFSIVRDKIIARTNWSIYMFWDCERRNFVIQKYHRDVLEQKAALQTPATIVAPPAMIHSPPPLLLTKQNRSSIPQTPVRRVSQKRLRRRRHRKVAAGNRETTIDSR